MKIIKFLCCSALLALPYFISFVSVAEQQPHWLAPLQQTIQQHYVHQHKTEEINRRLTLQFPTNLTSNNGKFIKNLAISLREISGDNNFNIQPTTEQFVLESSNNAQQDFSLGHQQIIQAKQGIEDIHYLENDIGYLKVSHIYNNAEAQQRIINLFDNIKPVDAFVLDLTDTQGDSMAVAHSLLNFFFEQEKTIARLSFAQAEQSIELRVLANNTQWQRNVDNTLKMPVYVLTSAFTSGTAELIAFSLQYFDKALVIGKPTMGNTFITQQFNVNNHLLVTMPIAQYSVDKNNVNWQGSGVIPDIDAEHNNTKNTAIDTVLEFLLPNK